MNFIRHYFAVNAALAMLYGSTAHAAVVMTSAVEPTTHALEKTNPITPVWGTPMMSTPEPSTWAMLIIGFGLLALTGWRANRRKNQLEY